jgi:ribonuclease BN (tRNA processing enzyme)
MLRLTVVGCAPGMPQPHLASSAYLVATDNTSILLDAGEGLSSALLRCGVDPLSISAVFISHLHPDHCIGLPLFIQMNYLQKRVEPLDIYLPSEASAGFRQLLDLTYLFSHKLGFDMTIHGLEDGSAVAIGDLTVRVIQNSHLKGHSSYLASAGLPNRMQCFSFVVEGGDRRIVYSGDLSSLDDIRPILTHADLLVIDGMHIDLSRLPEVVIAAGVRRVLLTHVAEDFDFDRVKSLFNKRGLENVCLAREGFEIVG